MSILKPATTIILPEQPQSAIRSRFERLSMYFPIYNPGTHSGPVDWSFCHIAPSSEDDRDHYRIYCDTTPTCIQNGIHARATAVVFEVTARIHPQMCFLTTDGDRTHPYVDGDEDADAPAMASCWLEAAGDSLQDRTIWQRALKRLQQIVQRGVADACMDEFITPVISPGTANPEILPGLLQVSWKPLIPFDLKAFPFLTNRQEHIPLPSRDQIPFGRRVRVHFILHSGVSPATKTKGPLVAARIVYMHLVD